MNSAILSVTRELQRDYGLWCDRLVPTGDARGSTLTRAGTKIQRGVPVTVLMLLHCVDVRVTTAGEALGIGGMRIAGLVVMLDERRRSVIGVRIAFSRTRVLLLMLMRPAVRHGRCWGRNSPKQCDNAGKQPKTSGAEHPESYHALSPSVKRWALRMPGVLGTTTLVFDCLYWSAASTVMGLATMTAFVALRLTVVAVVSRPFPGFGGAVAGTFVWFLIALFVAAVVVLPVSLVTVSLWAAAVRTGICSDSSRRHLLATALVIGAVGTAWYAWMKGIAIADGPVDAVTTLIGLFAAITIGWAGPRLWIRALRPGRLSAPSSRDRSRQT